MDWKKPVSPIEPPIPVSPSSRSEARRYVGYRNLLTTGRAVWKQRTHVWYSTAGDNPQVHRLSCATGQEAKRLVIVLSGELRKARSDEEYNRTIIRFLAEIRSAWPVNTKVRHVHQCDRGNVGEACGPNPAGVTPCGMDWTRHQLTTECACGVTIDTSDASGEWEFVVHRNYEQKVQVTVQ